MMADDRFAETAIQSPGSRNLGGSTRIVCIWRDDLFRRAIDFDLNTAAFTAFTVLDSACMAKPSKLATLAGG